MIPPDRIATVPVVFWVVCASVLPVATEGISDQIEVEAVIEKYIDSQGGRDLIASVTTFSMQGAITIESQGLEIAVVQKMQTPDKLVVTQDFPALGVIREVLNGNSGWEWHPITGERPLDETEIEDLRRDTDLQRDLKLFEVYQCIRIGEPETIEGVETIHLIFLEEAGGEEHWYFKDNGDLFQKIHTVSAGPESEFESTERFYDFEELDGFRFPRRIRYINPAYTAELKIFSCHINEELDPGIFELPEYGNFPSR